VRLPWTYDRIAGSAVEVALLMVVAAGGCRPMPAASGAAASPPLMGRGTVITEDEIARMAVRTAWDVVRMRAPHLTSGLDDAGQPTRIRIQAERSVNSDETPLLVVDGVRVGDILYLRDLSASEVRSIRILDSEAAMPLYGLAAGSGAIVVETKRAS